MRSTPDPSGLLAARIRSAVELRNNNSPNGVGLLQVAAPYELGQSQPLTTGTHSRLSPRREIPIRAAGHQPQARGIGWIGFLQGKGKGDDSRSFGSPASLL